MDIHLGLFLTNTKSVMDPRASTLARQEEAGRSARNGGRRDFGKIQGERGWCLIMRDGLEECFTLLSFSRLAFSTLLTHRPSVSLAGSHHISHMARLTKILTS